MKGKKMILTGLFVNQSRHYTSIGSIVLTNLLLLSYYDKYYRIMYQLMKNVIEVHPSSRHVFRDLPKNQFQHSRKNEKSFSTSTHFNLLTYNMRYD